MPLARVYRPLLYLAIPAAFAAIAVSIFASADIWSQIQAGQKISLYSPGTLIRDAIIAVLIAVAPTAMILLVIAHGRLWGTRLAAVAVSYWLFFTLYAFACITALVVWSR